MFAKSAILLHPGANLAVPAQTVATTRPAETLSPQVTPLSRATAVDRMTINPAILRVPNPIFHPPGVIVQGVDRASLSLPTLVSPVANPDDGTLFEDPQGADRKFFLTHYAIAQTATGAAPGRWVTFAPQGAGFLLTVHLIDTTAAAQSQGNGRLTPDTRYLISATVQGRIATWDLSAGAAGSDGSLTLTVTVPDFAGRDLLYAAMTDPAAGAVLILRRSLPLALPIANTGRYSTTTQAVDSDIAFTFNKDLDAAVFAGLGGRRAYRSLENGRPSFRRPQIQLLPVVEPGRPSVFPARRVQGGPSGDVASSAQPGRDRRGR